MPWQLSWLERWSYEPTVVGSIPTQSTFLYLCATRFLSSPIYSLNYYLYFVYSNDPYLIHIRNNAIMKKISIKTKVFIIISSSHHHPDKLFIVDVAISIDICFSDHLINFFFCQFLPQVCHHMSKFSCRYQSISISIKYFECFN